MAVYNTPFYLVKKAIESVLNQVYDSFELIVIDDGSDFLLSRQLLHFCQANQDKITYLRHQNCGQSQSTNIGIRLSRGNYITFVDSDDEYKPNHLAACLNEMYNADLISSYTETIVNSEEDYYVPDKDNNQLFVHVDDCILFATLFGKREVFLQASFKNMYAADAHFYENAALNYKVKKVNLRTYKYFRNISSSVSAKLKKEQLSLS